MSNSVIHAFFVGRAIAQVINEQVEDALTNALSELGKFDAEQRERLRQFTEEVMARAPVKPKLTDKDAPLPPPHRQVSQQQQMCKPILMTYEPKLLACVPSYKTTVINQSKVRRFAVSLPKLAGRRIKFLKIKINK